MKNNIHNIFSIKFNYFIALFAFFFIACNADKEDFQGEKFNSMNSGDLTIYCDEAISKMMDSAFTLYQSAYPKVNFTAKTVSSREAMRLLLSGNADVVISARGFLPDEDSLMKEFNAVRPEMTAAEDALVLFTRKDTPLDTLNDSQIFNVLSGKSKFLSYFPNLKSEPSIVSNSTNSSEFANINLLILKNQTLTKYIQTFNSPDSVINYVSSTPNSIGIGYLSQVIRNDKLKCIEIGFDDSTGKRIYPQVVHQGYILQKKYPYINKINIYLKEESKQNPAFWFASYISKETVVQKYFLDFGIVPEFAKIKIKIEDKN